MTPPESLAALLPALLCGAVEDITGHPCRRLQCDGTHSWDGDTPWPAREPGSHEFDADNHCTKGDTP